MSNPELDQQFFDAIGDMELSDGGIFEYQDITAPLQVLREELVEQLIAIGGFHPDDQDAEKLIMYLQDRLGARLERLDCLDYDDRIIASGQTIAIDVDPFGMQNILVLGDDFRLHGNIGQPMPLEVPLSLGILTDDDECDIPDTMPLQLAASIEITDASTEVIDPAEPFETPEPVGEGHRVFLPIAYPGLRVKRRI